MNIIMFSQLNFKNFLIKSILIETNIFDNYTKEIFELYKYAFDRFF